MERVITRGVCFLVLMSGIFAQAQTYNGYTLYSKMGNHNAYLIDMNHNIYHSWTFTDATGYSSYLLANGYILRAVQYANNQLNGAAMCGEVQKADWNGNVVWTYIYSTSTYCTHHDIHPMPNGNVLLISYEVKTAAQVIQAGGIQNIIMWPDKIIEVQPQGATGGTIVWEWHAWDHLIQDHDATKSNYGVVANHPELLNINYLQTQDWLHLNGIDYNSTLDQITFSSHNLDEIYVIDHSTTTSQAAMHTGGNSGKGGDIIYRWGNPAAYNQGTLSNRVFNIVHDAHWVPANCPKANDLVGFNNQGAPGNHSCVDIFVPPYNGYSYYYTSGTAYAPSTYAWRHICLGDAQDQSSSQQFPNGNMLICISSTGYIYEIDSNQTMLWSYTAGGTVPKAYRYTACYVNGSITVTASASPTSLCIGGSSQLNASASGGSTYTYSWTSNPPGFTSNLQNPTATPTVTTTYKVTVTSDICTASDSVSVTVSQQPTVTASALPPMICVGGYSQLNANATGSIAYTYSWTSIPPGYTSNQQNPIVTPLLTTTYIVQVSGSGCSGSDSTTVAVNQLPLTPTIGAMGDTLYSSASYGNQWYFNGTAISGATNQMLIVTQDGYYSVQITDINGCASQMSASYHYVGPQGIQEQENTSFVVYPNPTTGKITFSGDMITGNYKASLYNTFGKLLIEVKNSNSLYLSMIDNGIYFLVVNSENSGTIIRKVILYMTT